MTVDQFMANKELMSAHAEFVNSPLGRAMRELATEECSPLVPTSAESITDDRCSFCLGETAGKWKMRNFIFDLSAPRQVIEQPIPTFGAKPEKGERLEDFRV